MEYFHSLPDMIIVGSTFDYTFLGVQADHFETLQKNRMQLNHAERRDANHAIQLHIKKFPYFLTEFQIQPK